MVQSYVQAIALNTGFWELPTRTAGSEDVLGHIILLTACFIDCFLSRMDRTLDVVEEILTFLELSYEKAQRS